MSNQYELAGREKKVDALMKALDWVFGRQVKSSDVLAMSGETLEEALQRAAINAPSDATITALAERIKQREEGPRIPGPAVKDGVYTRKCKKCRNSLRRDADGEAVCDNRFCPASRGKSDADRAEGNSLTKEAQNG